MKKLVRNVGNKVTGDRFWDRENEVDSLIKLLKEGANVLITGQRRMGKTSLINEVGERIKNDYICLQLDLQREDNPTDAITQLCVETKPFLNIWNKTKEIFRSAGAGIIGSIDSLKIDDLRISFKNAISNNWKEKGERILETLSVSEKRVIIFIDEYPYFINRLLKGPEQKITAERLRETELFVSWMRAMTIKYQGKLQFVLTGSIGLEPILRQAKLSASVNNFTPFELKPWEAKIASGCIQALANNYKVIFEKDTIELMIEILGCCIPHHVQKFFSCIYDDCKMRNNMRCGLNDVSRVYDSSMLSLRGQPDMSTYEERLKTVLDETELPFAIELLTETGFSGKLTHEAVNIISNSFEFKGRKPGEVIREVLGILEHDGYVEQKDGNYVFVSKFVKDWWKKRFGFNFIPAAKRMV